MGGTTKFVCKGDVRLTLAVPARQFHHNDEYMNYQTVL